MRRAWQPAFFAQGCTPARAPYLLAFVLLIPLASQLAFSQMPAVPAPDGGAIFAQRCAKCHGDKGQGISSPVTIAGPNIQAEHDHGAVMTAMEVGPSHMPRFAYVLSVAEMRAVADYVTQQIAVIPLAQGDLSEGGALFRVYCSPCHRAEARGGALVFTGVNAPNLTGKSPALLAGAIRWGPGPMPSFPASVLTDKQVDSIVSYIQFLKHAPAPGGSALHWNGPVAEGFVAWVIVFGLIAITGVIEKGGKG